MKTDRTLGSTIDASRSLPTRRPRRGYGRAALAGVVVGLGAALVLSSLPRAAPPARLHGMAVWDLGRRPAPGFVLRDQSGRDISPGSERGHLVLLTFMDSHCRRACPIEGRELQQTVRSLPPGQRPEILIVSVNPADTPASAQLFADKAGFAGLGQWHWLMGTRSALVPVWGEYGVGVKPTAGDIEHTTVIYLIDPRGDERAAYGVPFEPTLLASDVRALEQEGVQRWHWPWS